MSEAKEYTVRPGHAGDCYHATGKIELNNNTSQAKLKMLYDGNHRGIAKNGVAKPQGKQPEAQPEEAKS